MARILVVDDDLETLKALEEYLEGRGYEVQTSKDGSDALRKSAAWGPDIILLDFLMDGMSGAEFLRVLREFPADASVIVVTGHPVPDLARYLLELGAKEFIHKPIDLGYLELTISMELALRQSCTARLEPPPVPTDRFI